LNEMIILESLGRLSFDWMIILCNYDGQIIAALQKPGVAGVWFLYIDAMTAVEGAPSWAAPAPGFGRTHSRVGFMMRRTGTTKMRCGSCTRSSPRRSVPLLSMMAMD
jgi:hypothetical protein